MKIVITGATGFIGRVLTKKLLQRGYEVAVLTRNPTSALSVLPGVEAYFWNPTEELPHKNVLNGVNAVINLAGENIAAAFWSNEQKERIRNSRILSTRNLVRAIALLEKKPKVLVSASAIGYYGNRGEEELTETSASGLGFLSQLGVEWEEEALKAKKDGVRVAVVRTGIVLGKGGGALEKMLLPFKLGLGGKLGDGQQWMSWIHINDLAELYIHAMEEEGVPEILNGTAPEPVTNEVFTRTFAAILSRPAFFRVPAFALKLVLGEMSEILLGSQRVLPKRTLQSGFAFRYTNLSDAFREILA